MLQRIWGSIYVYAKFTELYFLMSSFIGLMYVINYSFLLIASIKIFVIFD